MAFFLQVRQARAWCQSGITVLGGQGQLRATPVLLSVIMNVPAGHTCIAGTTDVIRAI